MNSSKPKPRQKGKKANKGALKQLAELDENGELLT
jgi:hypothetical protein